MKKYMMWVAVLLLCGCQKEEIVKPKLELCMTISDALPIQFWIDGIPTFNDNDDEAGIVHTDFCQPFNFDDEILIQIQHDGNALLKLIIYNEDDEEITFGVFTEVAEGVYEFEFTFEELDIEDQFVKLVIVEYSLGEVQSVDLGNQNWQAAAYGNGVWVAVGSTAGVNTAVSPDGITWDDNPAIENNAWSDVTFGDGVFVAVSTNGTNRVMVSEDGISWTAVSVSAFQWLAVQYENNRFVAVGTSGHIMYSDDGYTWTNATTPNSINLRDVHYGNGIWVAVGGNVSLNSIMYSTDNGVNWIEVSLGTGYTFNTVAFGAGLFVAANAQGYTLTSTDGITWTVQSTPSSHGWTAITFGAGVFVAVNDGTATEYMVSMDGITWQERTDLEDMDWGSVAYGNGLFVVVAPDLVSENTVNILELEVTTHANSDLLDLQSSHADSRLVTYSNTNDFADVIYSLDYPPTFNIRLKSKFYKERFPEENESEDLSDGSVAKLMGSVKRQKLLQMEPLPNYMHYKIKLILQHNSIYLNNRAYVKEESYEQKELHEKYPFQIAEVWLTQKDSTYTRNV